MKQKNNFKLFGQVIFTIIAVCLNAGTAAPSVRDTGAEKTAVSDDAIISALRTIKYAYESREVMAVMDCLDQDYDSRLEFQAALQDYLLTHKNIEVLIIQDSYLIDKGKICVKLHWIKNAMGQEGGFTQVKGSSEFVFQDHAGELKLYGMKGDNLFY